MDEIVPEDEWIKNHSIIDPHRLHALGVVQLWWTQCERHLLLIFCIVFNIPGRTGWIIGHDIGDVSLSNKIAEMLPYTKLADDSIGSIINYISVYDRCRQNRNMLSHFVPSVKVGDDLTSAIFVRRKGIKGEKIELPSDLSDLRRVAEEILTLARFSWTLYRALDERRMGRNAQLPPLIVPPELLAKPLPDADPESKQPRQPSKKERRTKRKERRDKLRPRGA